MMICGTLTLRYLFRIVLSGAGAKGTHVITSELVTRQGGKKDVAYDSSTQISYPISMSCVLGVSTTGTCFGSTGRWFAASVDTFNVERAGMVIRTTCAESETWISQVSYIIVGF